MKFLSITTLLLQNAIEEAGYEFIQNEHGVSFLCKGDKMIWRFCKNSGFCLVNFQLHKSMNYCNQIEYIFETFIAK